MKLSQLFLFIVLLSLTNNLIEASPADVKTYFLQVDSVLNEYEYYTRNHDNRARELQSKLLRAETIEEQYLINRLIFEEYKVYISDSAMHYLDACERLSILSGKSDWMAETKINQSYIYAATGRLKDSREMLNIVNRYNVSPHIRIQYYTQYIYHHYQLGNYFDTSYGDEIRAACDSILSLSTDPSDYSYLWAYALKESDKVNKRELISTLENTLLKMPEQAGYWNSQFAIIIARFYNELGDKENYVKYLAYTVMSDIRQANHDIPSLILLSQAACDFNSIEHAYLYVKFCLSLQSKYPDRARYKQIISSLESLYDASQNQYFRERDKRLSVIYVLVVTLALLFILSIIIFILLFKRTQERKLLATNNRELDLSLRNYQDIQGKLALVNQKLETKNNLIEKQNSDLMEANHLKEEYIGILFTFCSEYIIKLEDYRKKIYRKLQVAQYNEVKILVSSSEKLTENEVNELYKKFDQMFLKLYPDFIQDFNSLLRPDEQITVRGKELLNNDLRIYALVRLGIQNSTKIAGFLHISTQTVYNSRLRISNKASLSEEKFADRVLQLGKTKKTI